MSKLFLAIGGVTSLASIAWVTTAYLLTRTKVRTFKQQFKLSFIEENGDENSAEEVKKLFVERLKKLKESKTDPDNQKLKLAKYKAQAAAQKQPTVPDNTEGLEELKQGCKEIYESNFINKKHSPIIKDFAEYCSKTNILLWRNSTSD